MPHCQFEQTEAYILKRHPYRENHYLLDIFTEEHGRFRATARLGKQKTYRMTDLLAPFHRLKITGRRKHELATIWDSQIFMACRLPPRLLMNAHYANELILTHLPPDFADPHLYSVYRQTVASPHPQALRQLEYTLLTQLYQIPDITDAGEHYRICHGEYGLSFTAAENNGYPAELIHAFISGQDISKHPLSKPLLQTLLRLHQRDAAQTRHTASALHKLLGK